MKNIPLLIFENAIGNQSVKINGKWYTAETTKSIVELL
jgi:hypothetical protein